MSKLSERQQQKLDTLKYRSNISPDTQANMKGLRAKYYALAEEILSLGDTRETSEAFTLLETSLQFAIKQWAISDPDSVPEPIEGRECCGNSCDQEDTSAFAD